MRLVSAVLVVTVAGCVAPPGTREVRVEGLPVCPKGKGYARQIVVRLDRDRSLFDEVVTRTLTFDQPPAAPPVVTVPRGRMLVTMRAGLCAKTSLGTWDCNAVLWLATQQLALDAGKGVHVAKLPPTFVVECAR